MKNPLQQNNKNNGTPQYEGANPDYLIDLREVVKVYETPAGPFYALQNVNLQVAPGEFAAVIGKSGSGKSTLINMITGIDQPSLGEIYVAGAPLHTFTQSEIARWRGRNLGVVFQFFQLIPTLTLVENIMLPMEFCRLYSRKERYARAMDLLQMVGIEDQAKKFPSAISGGQQQRVAIARSLANDPSILVADEPTGNLDTKTADAIFKIFSDFTAQGKTLLMVTHDRDLASRVNRVVFIADGDIVDQQVSRALPSLDEKQLVELSSRMEATTFTAGDTIFKQGDTPDKFYIIVKGEVEVIHEHSQGKEIILTKLRQGEYFGEAGLIQEQPRNATIRVSTARDAVLMSIEKDVFAKLIEDSHLTNDAVANLMQSRTTTKHLVASLSEQVTDVQTDIDFDLLEFEPGEIIFNINDPADKFYLVQKGEVEVLSSLENAPPIATLAAGQYFGEMGLLHPDGRRNSTVRAAPDSTTNVFLVAINQETFHQALIVDNLIKDEIAVTMQQRLDELSANELSS
mgnify:CR=1 FL=1